MIDRVLVEPIAEEPATVRAIVDRARRRGLARFVLTREAGVAPRADEEVVERHDDRLLLSGRDQYAPIRTVDDLPGLERLLSAVPDGSVVVVEWTGDRVIPLEWAVAKRGRRFHLWTIAHRPEEAPAALGALEHGADRVVVQVRTPEDVDRLEALLDRPSPARLDWVSVPVTGVRPAGPGDRVIVDTTSLLRPEEGLLVGSAAAFLFHVASEAVGSAFSRPRPFRVNAGSAHSYVLMADGSTRYLSELAAGDSVLVAIPDGPTRSARVGRIKVERRPLSTVRVDDDGRERTVFLQEAETVRLSVASGRRALTELVSGESVWGVRLPPARHLGAEVQETIEER